jgi:hypothetical protein
VRGHRHRTMHRTGVQPLRICAEERKPYGHPSDDGPAKRTVTHDRNPTEWRDDPGEVPTGRHTNRTAGVLITSTRGGSLRCATSHTPPAFRPPSNARSAGQPFAIVRPRGDLTPGPLRAHLPRR